MSLETRHIEVEIQLGKGDFGGSGFNTVTLKGHRVTATITKSGGAAFNQLNMSIYGMTMSQMNELVTVGSYLDRTRTNFVTVRAWSGDATPALVFTGTIFTAWANFTAMPDVCLTVVANTGSIDAMKPADPTSYQGSVDVGVIMSNFATRMGKLFENSGVSITLSNPVFRGTLVDQVQDCARAAGIEYIIENDTLAIWPRNGNRKAAPVKISKETGLVGYPSFTQLGITLKTLFNPNALFMGPLDVQSTLLPVNGTWYPHLITHEIDAEMPGGKWFTTMECIRDRNAIPV